jgi:uncharacterized membrane protein
LLQRDVRTAEALQALKEQFLSDMAAQQQPSAETAAAGPQGDTGQPLPESVAQEGVTATPS